MAKRPSLPVQMRSDDPLPSSVIGYFSVQGPRTVFKRANASGPIAHESTKPYHGRPADRTRVRRALEKEGFKIIAESPLGISVSGPPEAFAEITGGQVITVERLTRAEGNRTRYVTHLDIEGKGQPPELGVGAPKSAALKVDGILLERPKIPMAVIPSPIPANSPRPHLRVPADVSVGLGATKPHRDGLSGQDVKVAMPDSGWYRHPFFAANHYNVATPITVVPNVSPSGDPVGHGTGESANIFAIAPGAQLLPIRVSDDGGNLVGAIAGFLKAKDLQPQIITCSWGGDEDFPPDSGPSQSDQATALEIQHAIESGICVVFSAGNGQFSIEPQVAGVLAAGGVFMNPTLDLTASNYASGYESPWFPGRIVPDVCGLVGLLPRAQYLMLPVPPGSELDEMESKPDDTDPQGDGTTATDGWALFSGTSGAAPQLAGAVAVLLEVNKSLTPAQIIEAFSKTAIDITSGNCHPRFNNLAGPGRDLATGFGLVSLADAVEYVRSNFPSS
jgi:hypothetical protein